MPENAKQKFTKRDQISPQETFRYTTPRIDVSARPVDTFEKPNATPLAGIIALSQSMQNGILAYGQYKHQQNKIDETAGAAAQMRGDPAPESGSYALMRGYEETEGKAGVYDFHAHVSDYVESNKTADPVAFREGLNNLIRNATDGKSDNYLRGFKDQALAVEGAALTSYQHYQLAQKKEDQLINVRKSMAQEIATNGLNDPAAARAFVTKLQKNSAGLLTKTEVTNAVMGVVEAKALETGNSNLFNFAYIPEDNKEGGQRLVDIIGPDKLEELKNKTLHQQRQLKEWDYTDLKRQEKEAQDNTHREFANEILNLGPNPDPKKAAALLSKIQVNRSRMDDNVFLRFGGMVQGLMGQGGFPAVTDPSARAEAYNKIRAGEMTLDELPGYMKRCNPADAAHLQATYWDKNDKLKSSNESDYTRMEGHYYNSLLGVGGALDMITSSLAPEQRRQRMAEANNLWYYEMNEAQTKAGGRNLQSHELWEVTQRVLEKIPGAKKALEGQAGIPEVTSTPGKPTKMEQSTKQPSPGGTKGKELEFLQQEIDKKKQNKEKASTSEQQGENTYGDMIRFAAAEAGIDPDLAMALVHAESSFNPKAVSPKGAIGFTQLMPGTAKDMGVDPNNPIQNLKGGFKYLKTQLSKYKNSIPMALAAYNAGPDAVDKHGGIPPYSETLAYISRVLDKYHQRSRTQTG